AKFEDGKSVTSQFRIVHKNGNVKWVEGKIIPQLDEKGTLVRVDGVIRDITQRKTAEEKVLQTKQLLYEAQKLAKMGNWSADFIKKEVFWSEGLRNIYGVNKDFPASFEAFVERI